MKSTAAQGLHDVVLDPDFSRNRILYFTYFAPPKGEAPATWPIEHFYEQVWTKPFAERRTMNLGTERVARARLSEDNSKLEDVDVLAEGVERNIVLAPDGTMFVLGADRFRFYDSDLDGVSHDFTDNPDIRRNFTGRAIRINRDGSIPKDNPWLTRATVPRETFAHGFKDPEGAAIIRRRASCGPSITVLRAATRSTSSGRGATTGGPTSPTGSSTTRDSRMAGRTCRLAAARTSMKGVEEPIYFWVPSIAPSGMMFYTGDLFPDWKGNLFVGAMSAEHGHHLVRLVLNGERVVAEEKLLAERKARIRFVRQAPDGSIYVIAGSEIWRLTPTKVAGRVGSVRSW